MNTKTAKEKFIAFEKCRGSICFLVGMEVISFEESSSFIERIIKKYGDREKLYEQLIEDGENV